MKTAELRDAMVARVKVAAAAWPTFLDMPENPECDIRIGCKANMATSITDYIAVLHSICAVATPTGRIGNDLVGFTDPEAEAAGQRIGPAQFKLQDATQKAHRGK